MKKLVQFVGLPALGLLSTGITGCANKAPQYTSEQIESGQKLTQVIERDATKASGQAQTIESLRQGCAEYDKVGELPFLRQWIKTGESTKVSFCGTTMNLLSEREEVLKYLTTIPNSEQRTKIPLTIGDKTIEISNGTLNYKLPENKVDSTAITAKLGDKVKFVSVAIAKDRQPQIVVDGSLENGKESVPVFGYARPLVGFPEGSFVTTNFSNGYRSNVGYEIRSTNESPQGKFSFDLNTATTRVSVESLGREEYKEAIREKRYGTNGGDYNPTQVIIQP